MLLILLTALSSPAAADDLGPAAQQAVTRSLPANMPLLQILGNKGNVVIRYDDSLSESQVTVTPVRWGEQGCKLVFSGDAEHAVAAVLPGEQAKAMERCQSDWEIVLASNTAVEVELRAGRVQVVDTMGRVKVELGHGRVLLQDSYGRVDAVLGRGKVQGSHLGEGAVAVGVGRVKLENLQHAVSANVEIGGVKLAFDQAPAGTVVARVGLGRVRTALPYGSYADMEDFDHRLSRFHTQIPQRFAASTRLEGGAKVGSTRVETVLDHEQEAQVVLAQAE